MSGRYTSCLLCVTRTESTMQNVIDAINLRAKEHDFSGVISIFGADTTIYHRAFGYRDIRNKIPNTTETKFGIASGTKLFTALGIGKLIEEGKLAFDTRVADIYSDVNPFLDKDATILHLLTHTSGIYDYYDEELVEDFNNYSVEIPWFRLTKPSDYLPLFKNQQMKFPAGARFSYSNGAYVFLGILIEMIADAPYSDFIESEVLQAAGMANSGFFAFNDLPVNTALGYLDDHHTTNIYNLPLKGGGDGGMYATSEDLRAFWRSLFAGRIVSSEIRDTFLKTQYVFNKISGYGCGLYKKLDDSMYSIVGSDAGVGFESCYLLADSIVLNILSNRTDGGERMRSVLRECGL